MRFLNETAATTKMLALIPRVVQFEVIGSVLIDPEAAKDLDFLVLVDDKPTGRSSFYAEAQADFEPGIDPTFHQTGFLGCARWLFGEGWETCSGEYDDQDDKWGALRKGNVNLIVTTDKGWYDRALMASTVCEALKLTDKGDRIVAYRVIRDGYSAADANARRSGAR